MGFPGGCPLVPCGHTSASPAPRGSLGSLQHPGCWHNSPAGPKQKRGRTPARPHGAPWPRCPCSAPWGGQRADLQPEQQRAIEQDGDEFLVTGGPAGCGPWRLTPAPRASWGAQTPSQGPGPGSSASRFPGQQARGTYAEGPSSAHSGSSQQPTASPRPGKEGQERGYPPSTRGCPVRSTTCYSRPLSLWYTQCLGTAEPG